jgi:hypothetical protein
MKTRDVDEREEQKDSPWKIMPGGGESAAACLYTTPSKF